MRAVPLLVLFALACQDYGVNPKDNDPNPGLDSEPIDCPPQVPNCRDSAWDSEVPQDSEPTEHATCDDYGLEGGPLQLMPECDVPVSTGTFTPVLEWKKDAWTVEPTSNNIMMMPAVASVNDDNGDGLVNEDDIPDIIVITYGAYGTVRAVSGDGGREIFSVAGMKIQATGAVAVGDIDNDGLVEIVAPGQGVLYAFENDGSLKWNSDDISGLIYGTSDAPAIHDMDGDGSPEIVCGKAILNADGTLRGSGSYGMGGTLNVGTTSFAADIDLDGTLEVVTGNALYDPDGNTLWYNGEQDGYVAVGNFDTDPEGEIVVMREGTVRLQDSDGTVLWRSAISGSVSYYGGPPTVADFDGDGEPEIGVAGQSNYTVFDTDGTKLWENTTQDQSSGNTGSAVFDFEGDGVAEVVYADETRLWVFAGPDGAVKLESTEHSNATWTEYPTVADVDADGTAEIVVPNTSGHLGFYVFGDADSSWREGRRIWNQHAYSITNVNDDGTIPPYPDPNWATYNNFRSGDVSSGSGGSYPDLLVSLDEVCEAWCDVGLLFAYARVGNQGFLDVVDDVVLDLWATTPDGDKLLSSLTITQDIPAGTQLDSVTFEVSGVDGWDIRDLYVTVDGGNGAPGNGEHGECDEENNEDRLGRQVCLN